jgi:hypothetical protein
MFGEIKIYQTNYPKLTIKAKFSKVKAGTNSTFARSKMKQEKGVALF